MVCVRSVHEGWDADWYRYFIVPIIAVFTKYDQFRLEMEFKLEDDGLDNPGQDIIDAKMKKCFEEEYLGKIDGAPRHVRLESETFSRIAYLQN